MSFDARARRSWTQSEPAEPRTMMNPPPTETLTANQGIHRWSDGDRAGEASPREGAERYPAGAAAGGRRSGSEPKADRGSAAPRSTSGAPDPRRLGGDAPARPCDGGRADGSVVFLHICSLPGRPEGDWVGVARGTLGVEVDSCLRIGELMDGILLCDSAGESSFGNAPLGLVSTWRTCSSGNRHCSRT